MPKGANQLNYNNLDIYLKVVFFFFLIRKQKELVIKKVEKICQKLQGLLHCYECPLTILVVHTNSSLAYRVCLQRCFLCAWCV